MAAAAIPWILTGLSSLGGLFGNRPKTTTTNTSSAAQGLNQTSGVSATFGGGQRVGVTSPTYDPLQQNVRDTLLNAFTNLATTPVPRARDVVSGLLANQMININRGAVGQRRSAATNLASRGLGFSPIGSLVDTNINNNRVSQLIQAENQAPSLELELQKLFEDMQINRLKSAGGFFSTLPTGRREEESTSFGSQTNQDSTTRTALNQTGQSISTGSGDKTGGALGGLATMLAYLYGQGAFDKP